METHVLLDERNYLEKFHHSIQVVSVDQGDAFPQQRPPDLIPEPDRVVRRVPVPDADSPAFRRGYLSTERAQLLFSQCRSSV